MFEYEHIYSSGVENKSEAGGGVATGLTFYQAHFSPVIFEIERQGWEAVLRAAASAVRRAVGPVPTSSSCHSGRDAWVAAFAAASLHAASAL